MQNSIIKYQRVDDVIVCNSLFNYVLGVESCISSKLIPNKQTYLPKTLYEIINKERRRIKLSEISNYKYLYHNTDFRKNENGGEK